LLKQTGELLVRLIVIIVGATDSHI